MHEGLQDILIAVGAFLLMWAWVTIIFIYTGHP
jgi:hypothetical protein